MESATTPTTDYDEQSAATAVPNYCSLPPQPMPALSPDLEAERFDAIVAGITKWANGTILHYYFFDRAGDGSNVRMSDGTTEFRTWVGADDQRDAVRRAFKAWEEVGIGLSFKEVGDRNDAEIRVGFMAGDGSWSHLGKNILGIGANQRTMNFGWDLTRGDGPSTALHEIGHTLGMPHEHQNPFAGIVWDEERVYQSLAQPPNSWPREKTFHNVLRKLSPNEVQGSEWDPDSIMEYPFPPGLIKQPARYHQTGIDPPGTLSPLDKSWALKWYPTLQAALPKLTPFKSMDLALDAGEQADFEISPPSTRKYRLGTFGAADTVMVLFEEVGGELRQVAGDDDSGTDRNALLRLKLFKGRRYVLRVRLYWAKETGETAVMYW